MSESTVGLIMMGFFAFCVFMIVITTRARRASKKAQLNKMNELNAKEHGIFKHVVGLPLPENVDCDVYYCDEKIMIDSTGSIFNLDFSKVSDITLTTNVDIQKAYVSSAGGAVGGAMLFGPLGALVDGRLKQKKIKQITNYLVITFVKDGQPDYISFKATNILKAQKIVNLFRLRPQSQKIEVNL